MILRFVAKSAVGVHSCSESACAAGADCADDANQLNDFATDTLQSVSCLLSTATRRLGTSHSRPATACHATNFDDRVNNASTTLPMFCTTSCAAGYALLSAGSSYTSKQPDP